MDKEYERLIVKAFFNKSFQERIMYELSSKRKRKDAIGRLSHDWNIVLNSENLRRIQEPCNESSKIVRMLQESGSSDTCYSISFCEEIDAKYMPLQDALRYAFGYGLPSLIVCQGEKLAYFEAEQECGAPPRFILKRKA